MPNKKELQKHFSYFNGVLYRNDKPVGTKTEQGYLVAKYLGKLYLVHRLTWQVLKGDLKPDMCIDHINRDRSDNRIENLRQVTKSENNRNKTGGVSWNKQKKKWTAYVKRNKKQIFLGQSDNFDEAILLRRKYDLSCR